MNQSAALVALVWLPTVTVTSTPPVPAGLVAEQLVVELHVTLVAELAPNFTVVAPGLKFVPVIATTVPPLAGPLAGLMLVTVGVGVAPQLGNLKFTMKVLQVKLPPLVL